MDDIRRWSDELARDPSSLVFLQLSDALRRKGQLDLAFRIAARGLERHQRNVDAHDLVARIAVARRDFDRAFTEWDTVLRIAPAHVGALKGLGYVCFQLGRFGDAEQYLTKAAAGGAGSEVANALEAVRRSSGSVSRSVVAAVPELPDPPASPQTPAIPADPEALFADLMVDAGQAALLLDGSGLVLAGRYVDPSGANVSQDVGAQLSGISDEVHRATRHLDVGEWKSITFETESAVVSMSPMAGNGLLVVTGSRTTPLGFLRRLLDRCGTRATAWLREAEEQAS